MSAFETNLIAIAWRNGEYDVVAQTDAPIDVSALDRDGKIHDVSENTSYVDEAAIIQVGRFAQYLFPESDPRRNEAEHWLRSLPESVMFIVVHRAQYESGL
jgi:hypothetical protein